MELRVLDANLQTIGILDRFSSMIWTDRYYGFGDFEVVTSPIEYVRSNLIGARYLELAQSDRTMIIENLNISTKVDSGDVMTIKGRSLETVLYSRIVWNPTILNGELKTEISNLLNSNAINPTDPDRIIQRMAYVDDPSLIGYPTDGQFFGEYLYDVIYKLCISKKIGFKVTRFPMNPFDLFLLELYKGVDRSRSQYSYPSVVFSPEFDNLISSDYIENIRLSRNVCLVAGEKGIGNVRTTLVVTEGNPTDLERREIFSDAVDVTRNVNGVTLSEEEYVDQLAQKGFETLDSKKDIRSFEGRVEPNFNFKFNTDYFLGDIVEVSNAYGHSGQSRVVEIIYSEDPSGVKIYPTFAMI